MEYTKYELSDAYWIDIRRKKNTDRIDECVGFMNDASSILSEYEYRLFNGGLSEEDIADLESEIGVLYSVDYALKMNIQERIVARPKSLRFNDLIKYQKYLLRELADIMIRFYNILTELKIACTPFDLKSFIKENSSLLHLVSTNNHSNQHIRKVSDDAYFYLCAFHIERHPSMRVNNHKNALKCYGCGENTDVIGYLMAIEGLNFEDALLLLAEINKIKVEDNPFTSDDTLVKKYTNAGAIKRYEARVISGEMRARYKNKTFNNYLALKKFSEEKETIARIRKNEYIAPENREVKKRLLYVVD